MRQLRSPLIALHYRGNKKKILGWSWEWLKGTRPISFTFGYLLLFPPYCPRRAGGVDGPPRQEYEENGVPGWRRLCEGNENPAVVLAREFSISDSANPFYLKLRNSIPPAALPPPCTFEARRNSPSRLFYPAGYSLPSTCLRLGRLRVSQLGGAGEGADGRFYIFQRAAGAAAAPPPARIFRSRDIGQQKLKSSVYSCTREGSKTAARLSRVFKSRDAGMHRS